MILPKWVSFCLAKYFTLRSRSLGKRFQLPFWGFTLMEAYKVWITSEAFKPEYLCHKIFHIDPWSCTMFYAFSFSLQMTTSHNYSIARAKALLGYRPVLNDGQISDILKSRGLPVRGAVARRSRVSGWSSKVALKACSFAFAFLGLLALLLVPAWDAGGNGGLVGKSIC